MSTESDKNAARMVWAATISLIGAAILFATWLIVLILHIGASWDPIVDRARQHCANVAAQIRRDARAGRDLIDLRASDVTWLCTGSWQTSTDSERWASDLEAGR